MSNEILQQFKRITPRRVARSILYRTHDVRYSLRLSASWRGQTPRVYLNSYLPNPIWDTYKTHPPLRYAPYPVAEVCHWVTAVKLSSALPSWRAKRHIYEIEHMLILPEQLKMRPGDRPMCDWHRVFDDYDLSNEFVAREECQTVLTFSAGLVEHFKQFLRPELWPKLDYVYPAYPEQLECEPSADEPFTILVIASRFSDKGVPEALRAYRALRERHGARVRMILVSQAVPENYQLPEGVIHHNIPRMSQEFKAQVYRSSDVLLLPNYGETAACFPEAYAFGVPVVTTRIHHGDEFVREGVTGYLLETPIFAFSEKFGSYWKDAPEFQNDLVGMRERGELDAVVAQAVDRLDAMITGQADIQAMRRAARQFHAECFSPGVRNRKLLSLYNAAAKCSSGERQSVGS